MNLDRINKLKGLSCGALVAIMAEGLVVALAPEFAARLPETFWDAALLLGSAAGTYVAPANAEPGAGRDDGGAPTWPENGRHA